MKKLLLSGVALMAVAAATPAKADEGLKLELGGYFSGYAVYNDQDEPTGTEYRNFDFRKDTEIHFTGETTLDNGLTVGSHIELNADREDNTGSLIEESYMYFSSGWGRVNFGEEDGAAYLLQVSAPSADSNIDGLRQYINSFDLSNLIGANVGLTADRLDYDQVLGTGKETKLTYFTPVFNGFQAGATFTPSISEADQSGLAGITVNNNAGYDYGYELAARYEGEFEGVGITAGAGYGHAEAEVAGAEDRDQWNVGLDMDFAAFGLGVAYTEDDNGVASNGDTSILVVGADYVTGPYTFGLSYYDREDEDLSGNQGAAADEVDTQRYTGGVSYEYGPGMSFRGSISYIDAESSAAGDEERDGYQIAVGTQISF